MAEYIIRTEYPTMWEAEERIVRCRDCKHMYKKYPFNRTCCDRPSGGFPVDPNGFCAWGKPKEG